jgi:hypothetical protein
VEINDPTHLTGHVCVDASLDEEKYQGFALSECPEEDRRGDRHFSGTRQRLCVDIYHVIFFFPFSYHSNCVIRVPHILFP